jgi:hypothetical protein
MATASSPCHMTEKWLYGTPLAGRSSSLCDLSDKITAYDCSPDGRKIVLSGEPWWFESSQSPDAGRGPIPLPDFLNKTPAFRIWDTRKGSAAVTQFAHSGRINALAFSSDGRRVVSVSEDRSLSVWDAATGRPVLSFSGNPFTCLAPRPGQAMAAGDSEGRVFILRVRGLDSGPTTLTAIYLFRSGLGRYEDRLSAKYQLCARFFVPPVPTVASIHAASGKRPLRARLIRKVFHIKPNPPDGAWDNPGLFSECPNCHKPLRFNPFIADSRKKH